MLLEVKITPHCYTFQLLFAVREREGDIGASFGIMRQLVGLVNILMQILTRKPNAYKPVDAVINPLTVQGFPVGVGMDEILDFHLLKLSAAENEVSRRNFISESLSDLGNPKGNLYATGINDVLVVVENPLRCFRTQISSRRSV